MSDKDERDDEHKQSTQAIAQEPQEEFISQENIPSKTEAEVREEKADQRLGRRGTDRNRIPRAGAALWAAELHVSRSSRAADGEGSHRGCLDHVQRNVSSSTL
jgi:hypothetical protein